MKEDNRWIIHKFGFLDFWYYDYEEFVLSDGKLLLRGTNGSGKSVTMQSLIPLLLDGNKSPERLDPFGTRSRKLENYLINENTDERTAYLYTEFKRRNSETYMTIGMGIRAQTGKPLDAWYFIISDGRRVGRDIYLYKQLEEKVALTKRQLQNELGSANFFTDLQHRYMDKVNEMLFGFEDTEGYEELLNLLIQLRSPKLSKDFKPTEIYNILTNSLKVLSEDDLRPMSESMENMDQLQTSKEEKERALRAANSIKYYYDRYNHFILQEKARDFDGCCRAVNEEKRQLEILKQSREKLVAEQQENEEKFHRLSEELKYAEGKYESLRGNDAFIIKEKLQNLGAELAKLYVTVEEKEKQLDNKKRERRNKEQKQREIEDAKELLLGKIKEQLMELKELAADFAFTEGEYLEKEVLGAFEAYDFAYLEVSLQKYTGRIREVKKILKEYASQEEKLNREQEKLDGIKLAREAAESELTRRNMLFTETKEELKENYDKWAGGNGLFKPEKEIRAELFSLINEARENMDSLALSKLDLPVTQAYNSLHARLIAQEELVKQAIGKVEDEIASVKNEIAVLRAEKDIEPERPAGVGLNRERLKEKGVPVIPFYKAVDFKKNVPEDTRNAIESALNDMGLLDALIVNTGDREKALSFDREQWDKYIIASGNMMSHNLSSYLEVVGDDLNSIAREEIENVLQSIYLEEDKMTALDECGNYSFGILKGMANQSYQAKYIGTAARKRHRELLICHKQEEMKEKQQQIDILLQQIDMLKGEIETVGREYSLRPAFTDMKTAADLIGDAVKELKKLEKEQLESEELLFTSRADLKKRRAELFEAAQGITIEKTVTAFEEAEEAAVEFRDGIGNAKMAQNSFVSFCQQQVILSDSIEGLDQDVDILYREISNRKNEIRDHENQTKAMKDTLDTMDIGALEAEMESCLQIKEKNPRLLQQVTGRNGEVRNSLDNVDIKLEEYASALILKEAALLTAQEVFGEELSLGYVYHEEGLEPQAAMKRVLKNAVEEEKKDRNFYTEKLMESHHDNSGDLREFNSKIVYLFEGENSGNDNAWAGKRRRIDINCRIQGKEVTLNTLIDTIKKDLEELMLLINTEERRIFEEVLLNTISSKISAKIYLSRQWVDKINDLMESMNTSSSLALSLKWVPKKAEREEQLDISDLLEVLERSGRANEEDMRLLAVHFGDKVKEALRQYEDTGEVRNYHTIIKDVLDYRKWFEFKLYFTKKNEKKRELTNNAFFQFSGGEKAMSMYVPLFSAVYARYENARRDCPRIISLDEAFAGVDENNIRDMFRLLKELRLDYILNSQVLWGDYDTVEDLSICELVREENDDVVSIVRYHWNGIEKKLVV